ncbi:MAG: toprim domain-containing protein, partial [Deltaproteobacteria bacterium]|nr:toprim domain-containing protein [Deltaproteobacteria bacterium]
MDDFSRIKAEVDLLEFILRESGRTVRKTFSGYVQIDECPFCRGHGCFTVQTGDEKYFKCFQCEAKGDIYSFVQAFRKLASPLEALRQIAGERGIPLETRQVEPPPDPLRIRRREIFEKALAHYQEVLFSEPGELALRYLTEERGHTLETIRSFGLGLTDGRINSSLRATLSIHDLVQSGLVNSSEDGRTCDAFPAGLIVFPHWTTGSGGKHIADITLKPYETGKTPLRLRSEFRDPSCLFLNQPALRERRIVVVEGQHDLLSVAGKAGFTGAIATCGQLSSGQIELMAKLAPGKTLYLAFDNDSAGRMYAEKLKSRLSDKLIPPVLQKLLGARGFDVRQLRWPSTARDIDEFLSSSPEPARAFEKLLDDAAPLYAPLGHCLELFRQQCSEQKRNFYGPEAAKDQADIIFEWLESDGRFFVQRGAEHKTYVSFRGQVFEIGDDPRFKTLLFELARLVYAEGRTKIIMEVVEYQCRLKGRRIEVSPWLHVEGDREIYLHPGRPDDLILRIADGQVQTVPNAVSCLLRPSNKMTAIEFDPDVNIQRAFGDFHHLFISNLSTTPESRYFTACWCLNIFLLG